MTRYFPNAGPARAAWRGPATAAGLVALLLASGCAATSDAQMAGLNAPSVETGRALAETRCASCHAVKAGQESPRAAAPTFVELNRRYVATTLQRRLAEMNETEHSEMPPLRVHWDEIEALTAYMQTLETQ